MPTSFLCRVASTCLASAALALHLGTGDALRFSHLDPSSAGSLVTYSLCLKPGAPFGRDDCPHNWDSASATDIAKACTALDSDMQVNGSSRGLETSPLKDAMLSEGAIAWIIAALKRYAGNVDIEDPCFIALDTALYLQEPAQHRAGELGLQHVLISFLRRNIGNRSLIHSNIDGVGSYVDMVGSYADMCLECGDYTTKAGGDKLMLDIARQYINDEDVIESVLNGLTGIVYHATDGGGNRDRLHQLGLPQLGLEIIKNFPNNTIKAKSKSNNTIDSWLNVRQEVIAVITGMCVGSPNESEILETVMQNYPAEALKLMRDEPKDAPSNAKSLEFMHVLAAQDLAYAKTLVHMGALEQTKWAMGNYTTPSGVYADKAGQFWNVNLAAVGFLDYLAKQGYGPKIKHAGLVPLLKKAVDEPEGGMSLGYSRKTFGARRDACDLLAILSVDYPSCSNPEVLQELRNMTTMTGQS